MFDIQTLKIRSMGLKYLILNISSSCHNEKLTWSESSSVMKIVGNMETCVFMIILFSMHECKSDIPYSTLFIKVCLKNVLELSALFSHV